MKGLIFFKDGHSEGIVEYEQYRDIDGKDIGAHYQTDKGEYQLIYYLEKIGPGVVEKRFNLYKIVPDERIPNAHALVPVEVDRIDLF